MKNKFELVIDYKSIIPVYEQIKQYYKMAILNNYYSADDKITSVRELAKTIKVNQNTIVKAYYQLESEGFIYSRPGRGYFVKEVVENAREEREGVLRNTINEFLEKVLSLGYSVNDVIAELENWGGKKRD